MADYSYRLNLSSLRYRRITTCLGQKCKTLQANRCQLQRWEGAIRSVSLYLLFTTLIGAFLATMCLFRTYSRSCGTSLVMQSSNLGARGQAPICGIPSLPRIIISTVTLASKHYKPSRRCLQALADSLMVVDLRAPGPQAVTHLVFASGGSCYVLKSLRTKSDYLHITPHQFHTLDL